jgi:hypothetical protein
VRKHRCAAGFASSGPAIPYVVTRDGRSLYTRGGWASTVLFNYGLDFGLSSFAEMKNLRAWAKAMLLGTLLTAWVADY